MDNTQEPLKDSPYEQLNDTSISPEDARRLQKEMRIELLRKLIIRGVKSPIEQQQALRQMSPSVKLTLRTIYRYRGVLKKRNAIAIEKKEGLKKTIEEIALELKETIEEVTKELWKTYHAPIIMQVKCPHPDHKGKDDCGYTATIRNQFAQVVKVTSLKEIRETTKQWTETLQSLGLVYVAPVKQQLVDAHGNPIDPPGLQREKLNQEFVQFLKAKFQDPLPSQKPMPEVTLTKEK